MKRADRLDKARNPLKQGRTLLETGYRGLMAGKERRRSRLGFEMLRSLVVQRVYESGKEEEWLSVADVEQEKEDSVRLRKEYNPHSMGEFLAGRITHSYTSKDLLRVWLDLEANKPERFLGSVREHAAGLGYAVSVRKWRGPNQDSFFMGREGKSRIYAVSDGCGGMKFSSIASYLAVVKIAERTRQLVRDPKLTICDISDEIALVLNAPDVMGVTNGLGLGATTLHMAIEDADTRNKDFFKVGDSLAFLRFLYDNDVIVEQIGSAMILRNVLGQFYPLQHRHVEEHERRAGKLVLTTDGITDALRKTRRVLEYIFVKRGDDSVVIAESLIRTALRLTLKSGISDDMTVVIQE